MKKTANKKVEREMTTQNKTNRKITYLIVGNDQNKEQQRKEDREKKLVKQN